MERSARAWVAYDVGNSAFVLIVVTTVMPIYFKDVLAAHLPSAVSTAYWGYANAAAALVLAAGAPLLGTLADYRGWKRRAFIALFALGVAATFVLAALDAAAWWLALVVYALARIGWAGANLVYDALLVDVAAAPERDRLSTLGYGWGYIGSVVPFLAVAALLWPSAAGGGPLDASAVRWGFVLVALWWAAWTVPLLRHVRQRHGIAPVARPVRDSLARLARTFRTVRRHRAAFLFLAAYFCYIDGVGTVITMATAYGRELGLGVAMLLAAVLFIQVAAWPGALLYGRAAARWGARRMILVGIGVYAVICALAFALPDLPAAWRTAAFWAMCLLVASSMGGVQALSRSFYAALIPPQASGEFFGFYNVVGRFAAISGPALVGLAGQWFGHSRWGVLGLLLLFGVGAWVLSRVPAPPTEEIEGA